jgi:hypothetical protein
MAQVVNNLNEAIELAKARHTVECRCLYDRSPLYQGLRAYVFFDCDGFAAGEYNPHTGVLHFYKRARFVPYHERALMPVHSSWRVAEPNYTLAFLNRRTAIDDIKL